MGHPTTTQPPTQTGGTTTPTSPAAGSAVSGTAAQTHARQVADAKATFEQIVGYWVSPVGFNLDHNIQKLINNAASGLWNTDRFYQAIAKTKEFHQAFPGIFNKNGTMRTDPTTYLNTRAAIKKAANAANLNLSDKQLSVMMVNQVDPTLAAQRFSVEASYTQNQGTFAAFNAELKAAGHKPMDKATINKFLMGQAPAQFYDLYKNWQARVSAQAAGFNIANPIKNKKGHIVGWSSTAGDLTLSRRQELNIAQMEGGSSSPDLTKAAQMFRDILPESRMAAAGISKDDIIQYLYGGPKQAQIQQTIDQFRGNLQAEQQDTTTSVTVQGIGQRGLASQNRAQGI